MPGYPGNWKHAKVKTVGKSVDPEDRTLLCTAAMDQDPLEMLVNGLHVEVEVTTDKKQVIALPDEAIVRSENSSYILLLKEKRVGNTTSSGRDHQRTVGWWFHGIHGYT